MCQSANRQIVVAGLVSFGASACGHKSIPGVYTDVASYMDWIRQNIN
jgi:secreted trypsin-like serine protease